MPVVTTERVSVQSRQTRQKQAIREAFQSADRPLAPEEALTSAQAAVPRISLATVYRNINALVDDKWLARVDLPGFPARYEIAGKQHHHHFHCRECGKVFELAGCEIKAKPKLPRGFRATGHEFYLYGSCSTCN